MFSSFALAVLITGIVYGATEEDRLKETALNQAKILEAAFNAKRYDIALLMMPKKLRDVVGSAEALEKQITTGLGEGVEVGKVEVGAILSFATFDGEHFVTLAKKTHLMIDGGACVIEGGLLGVSSDGGKAWEFMDVNRDKQADLKAYSVKLYSSLIFPETKMIVGEFTYTRQDNEWVPDAATLKLMRGILDGTIRRPKN